MVPPGDGPRARIPAEPSRTRKPTARMKTRSEPADLSCCLPLLIGFDGVEGDHGGRLSALGGAGPLVVVNGDPARDPGAALRSGLPGVQVNAFMLQGSPELLD